MKDSNELRRLYIVSLEAKVRELEAINANLVAALKPVTEFLAQNGGDAAYTDSDGTGWVSRAQDAIARARS